MIRLLPGDCRDVLVTLPADSVQCVVTSPPYYGLRDYGCAGQIGLEATPDEYLATMVAVFREVKRVLRPDGTCWVNMGDSYNNFRVSKGPAQTVHKGKMNGKPAPDSGGRGWDGLKEKDLLMMPARLALALQADGWWLRSDIIWHKPNPMPESCRDRPTNAHEHVFLITKSARYWYDADAVREDGVPESASRYNYAFTGDAPNSGKLSLQAPRGFRETNGTRNLRNVWTIATAPFPGSHFATMPAAVVERCIRAGSSERGCCSQCGKPWVRVVSDREYPKHLANAAKAHGGIGNNLGGSVHQRWLEENPRTTTGWLPSCSCNADVTPCTVLDPFAGAGTTLLVADRLQRDAIGIELNTAYTEMAMQRCRDDAPLFVDTPAATDPEEARIADLFASPEAA
jgi:DNA modification methylase